MPSRLSTPTRSVFLALGALGVLAGVVLATNPISDDSLAGASGSPAASQTSGAVLEAAATASPSATLDDSSSQSPSASPKASASAAPFTTGADDNSASPSASPDASLNASASGSPEADDRGGDDDSSGPGGGDEDNSGPRGGDDDSDRED